MNTQPALSRKGPILISVEMLQFLVEMAESHVTDIETGLEDGTYDKDDNPTIDDKRRLVDQVASMCDASAPGAQPYTVIGFNESDGSPWLKHVHANDEFHAFTLATPEAAPSDAIMVAVLPGHHEADQVVTFPGSALVDGATVLEQPEVFGGLATGAVQ